MTTPERLKQLWDEYCEAATPSSSNDHNGIDLYDVEGMDEAAHAIYQAALAIAPVWHRMDDPLNPPPKDGRNVALLIQYADESGQRIEWDVRFDPDLGGCLFREDGSIYDLPDNGEWATHWSDTLQVPPIVRDYGANPPTEGGA